MTDLWNTFFFDPMLNALLVISVGFFGNFGFTVIAFTLIIRTLMLPLTMKQLNSAKSMSALQPKIKELQQKYGKDRERLSKETMALYKEHGVNPIGCAVPTLIQFPIWIGLYQSITYALAQRPEGLLALSQHIFPALNFVQRSLPLNNQFLWLDLANPDPLYILPVLVAASMWVQQKMMTLPSADPQQAQMNKMMQTFMPLMFGFFTLQFASGLALYWLASNIYSIVVQYFITGWGSLQLASPWARPAAATAPAPKQPRTRKGGKKR